MRKTGRKIIGIMLASAMLFAGCSGEKPEDTGQVPENGNEDVKQGQMPTDSEVKQPENETGSEEEKMQKEQQLAILEKIGRGEDFHIDMFGENVYFFSPADEASQVQEVLDHLWRGQEKNQFGGERYAVYFLPGEYDENISVKVGYYMQVSGLGYLPDDTQVKALNCDARWLGGNDNHNATCNFWRGVENLRVNSTVMWAVSQATFMRRMHITGLLYLHDNNGWASGGFLSDSLIGGMVDSGSQQQWLSRNCNWNGWRGSNWNIVFAGIPKGKTPAATWPQKQYTNVETVEEMQEKPFLVYDREQGFGVFLPEPRKDAVGTSWQEAQGAGDNALPPDAANGTGLPEGKFIPLPEFYVARADRDNAQTLNAALREGKHLFFTPGIYDLDEELCVDRAGSIMLGSGLATLRASAGNLCMRVDAPEGTIVAGLLFDAGAEKSPLLFCVGNNNETGQEAQSDSLTKIEGTVGNTAPKDGVQKEGNTAPKDGVQTEGNTTPKDSVQKEGNTAPKDGVHTAEDATPTLLADLFFRVGGAQKMPTSVEACAELNSDHIIGDNFWVWRADHGDGVGWTVNTAEHGLIVNGNDVTIYALMVEHFRQYQTIWRGENGKVIMYQSEIPYDVPEQSEFMSHEGKVPGYASYKVADGVKSHTAVGIGIYSFNRDAEIEIFSAMETPEAPDIKIHHVIAVMITGNPGITHVLNELGGPLLTPGARDVVIDAPW